MEGSFMNNIPEVKLGLIAVSRDCFVISLAEQRCEAVAAACTTAVYRAKTIVENEADVKKAVEEITAAGCNALVVFLGNFGPETPETLIAGYFSGPVMYLAAAEESGYNLVNGRGDAYCGLLNCSYNLGLRNLKAVIPEYPVGSATDLAAMINDFVSVARALIGISSLKIITFGPRPQDFFACNAPIKPLYDLGIEIQENSELDLLAAFRKHRGDPRISGVVEEMTLELGAGMQYPELLPTLAQFELALLDWAKESKGVKDYVVFANKCWPAFPTEFGFEPCYVNSRLTAKGFPVACEVDIFGALSEYIGSCVTGEAVTLLDLNNTVPADIFEENIKGKYPYVLNDTFMGFHCGNTPNCRLNGGSLSYMLIQNRILENGEEPIITRGTLEGDIAAGDITFFRLQANADLSLQAYIAQGEVLPVPSRSFGGIGIFAISEMGRFYRHILIRKRYPHHGAVAFGHVGKALYTVFDYLGIPDISFNHPKGMLYKGENPFA